MRELRHVIRFKHPMTFHNRGRTLLIVNTSEPVPFPLKQALPLQRDATVEAASKTV